VLPLPPAIERRLRPPEGIEPGPMQTEVLEPMLIQMGLAITTDSGELSVIEAEEEYGGYWAPEEDAPPRKRSPAEMLKMIFDTQLVTPEFIPVQPKFVAGGLFDFDCDFHKYVRSRDLAKNEGLVLRHMLRLVILAGEFLAQSGGDPDYERIGEQATRVCRGVDERYTDRFLASEEEAKKLVEL